MKMCKNKCAKVKRCDNEHGVRRVMHGSGMRSEWCTVAMRVHALCVFMESKFEVRGFGVHFHSWLGALVRIGPCVMFAHLDCVEP